MKSCYLWLGGAKAQLVVSSRPERRRRAGIRHRISESASRFRDNNGIDGLEIFGPERDAVAAMAGQPSGELKLEHGLVHLADRGIEGPRHFVDPDC